ncbi:hypothetical protein DPMN_128047 [Dreissena polymorpha]|uniref:Uncharacterized protein n=1 Tax=Dreissena polymorpha TaxID=45954 RepID=A0A9D4H344_DREPO|nr:hypothetical protein DPMN_128047 [Dreissena polymorpha]
MIGFAIFADEARISQDMTVATFGPGFALCIVAWLSAWVVAILNGIVVFAGRTTNTNSTI